MPRKRRRCNDGAMQAITTDDIPRTLDEVLALRPRRRRRASQDDTAPEAARRWKHVEPPAAQEAECPAGGTYFWTPAWKRAAMRRCHFDPHPDRTAAVYAGVTLRTMWRWMRTPDRLAAHVRRLYPDPRDVEDHMRLIYGTPLFHHAVTRYQGNVWQGLIIPPWSAQNRSRAQTTVRALLQRNHRHVKDADLGLVLLYLMMTAHRTRKPTVLFRGQRDAVPWNDGREKRISNRMVSTATDGQTALAFTGTGCMLVYHLARNVPYLILPVANGTEAEVLLPPGLPMQAMGPWKRGVKLGLDTFDLEDTDDNSMLAFDQLHVAVTAP